MARTKKLTREELLAKKRAAEQARRDKLKLDPEAHEKYKEKEKQRYQKRKQEKKLLQINDMTPRQKRIQRRKWKINSKNSRAKKRSMKHLEQRLAESTPPDTDSDDNQTVNIFENQLEVPIECPPTPQRPATRSISRNISVDLVTPSTSRRCDSPNSDISSVKRRLRYNVSKKLMWYKKQLNDLRKKNDMLRKRLLRIKNNYKRYSYSPRTKADHLLSDPNRKEDVKKALVFAKTIKNNLTTNYENFKSNTQKKEFKDNIKQTRTTLKKYKMLKDLEPKMVRKVSEQKKLQNTKKRIERDIKIFFESDENSRMTAGKKECITKKKEKKQKRFLLDTLKNLHKKFLETKFIMTKLL